MANKDFMIDTPLATSAVTSPLWLQQVEWYIQDFMLFGGAILLAYRLYLMGREILEKRKEKRKEDANSSQ